jgi:hypothetical protein
MGISDEAKTFFIKLFVNKTSEKASYSMKVYQLKHHQMYLTEDSLTEEQFIEQYKELLNELLRYRNLGQNRMYEVISLINYTISSQPLHTEALLRKSTLPPFRFLACKN